MKRSKRFSIVIGVILFVSAFIVTSALAAHDPFVGAWESIDTDGSYQILRIGGGAGDTHHVFFYDYGGTVCDTYLGTTGLEYAVSTRATLTHTGESLSGVYSLYCQTSPPVFVGNYGVSYTYNTGSDTLTDNFGVTWNRR